MHSGLYSTASTGPILRVGEPRGRLPRPRPSASRGVLSEDDFADLLLRSLGKDAQWRASSVKVAELQVRLRRQVSDAAWQTYLDLEEQDVARWHAALLLVARWASRSRRTRRGRR